MFKNQIILVTGGTGSWGEELVRQLLPYNPKEIRIFSRNEANQFTMNQNFNSNPKLRFIISDIKEKDALIEACNGVHYVFHLAALKHVPVCELQPLEALKTNVIGTQNVIDAARCCGVKKVVYISTDKASDPSNFYGLSKAMGEKLIINANMLDTDTKFVCIRGGNVLGTNGSVIHVFKKQILEKKTVGITDLNMTRFFLTIQDAIRLVFKATFDSIGGEIFVMKMPSCKIKDIADVLIEVLSKENIRIEILGIRPGEKIHELLFSSYESMTTFVYDEEYYIILPTVPISGLKEQYTHFQPVNIEQYSSNTAVISKSEIKNMLQKGGLLQ